MKILVSGRNVGRMEEEKRSRRMNDRFFLLMFYNDRINKYENQF